jgi:hypothetical protein
MDIEVSGLRESSHTGRGWRVYVTTTRSSVKVPDIKRWVGEWVDEFGSPPHTVRIHPTVDRLTPTLHDLGVIEVEQIGGVLAWEIHIEVEGRGGA